MDFESADYTHLGDGGYDLGARARQIRDDLKAKDHFAPDDMLAIQLDDRAVFLEHWHELLLEDARSSRRFAALRRDEEISRPTGTIAPIRRRSVIA